jgi:hypothetical protein
MLVPRALASSPRATGGEILSVCEVGRNESSCMGGSNAARITRLGLVSISSSRAEDRAALVVPDGVARVSLTSKRGPGAVTVSAAVHANVAAFPRMPFSYGQAVLTGDMTWYSADGRLLKRMVPGFEELYRTAPGASFSFGTATSSAPAAHGRATSVP